MWSNPEPTRNITSRSLPLTVVQQLSRAPATGRKDGYRFPELTSLELTEGLSSDQCK